MRLDVDVCTVHYIRAGSHVEAEARNVKWRAQAWRQEEQKSDGAIDRTLIFCMFFLISYFLMVFWCTVLYLGRAELCVSHNTHTCRHMCFTR